MPAEYSVSVGFHKFCRYLIPGLFTAFWVVFYVIRLTHTEIVTAADLLRYLHSESDKLIPIIFAFGGFLGFCLVGIDAYVKSALSNRLVNAFHRYCLTSRFFKVPFFHFMNFRLVSERYLRLGINLIRDQGPLELAQIAKKKGSGLFGKKVALREILANLFWATLEKDEKAHLNQRRELSSTFLNLAFITAFLGFFQFLMYLTHIISSEVQWPDMMVFVFIFYVVFNLLVNSTTPPTHDAKTRTRYAYYILSILIILSFTFLLFTNVFAVLPWFTVADPLLLYSFIILYCGLYWAGVYRYAQYALSYEKLFEEQSRRTLDYIKLNEKRIISVIREYAPEPEFSLRFCILSIIIATIILGITVPGVLWPFITRHIILPKVEEPLLILILAVVLAEFVTVSIIGAYFLKTKKKGCA